MTATEAKFIQLLERVTAKFEEQQQHQRYFFRQYTSSMQKELKEMDKERKISRINDLLSQYGGMGSLNDLGINDPSLRSLLNELYATAKLTQQEHRADESR